MLYGPKQLFIWLGSSGEHNTMSCRQYSDVSGIYNSSFVCRHETHHIRGEKGAKNANSIGGSEPAGPMLLNLSHYVLSQQLSVFCSHNTHMHPSFHTPLIY